MADVELECAVYGEGTVFPVKIARDAKVSALQEAVFDKKRYQERYSFDASALMLYLAKKDGAWLKDDDSVDELSGKIDTAYKKMRPSWKLDDDDYFKKEFQPRDKEIHILVELPAPDSHCVDIGEPDPRLVKYQQQNAEDGSARLNGIYLSFLWALRSSLGCMDV